MEELIRVARLRLLKMDKTNEYEEELIELSKDLGLLDPMELPELCKVVERISYFNPSFALSLSAHHLALNCLKDFNGVCAFALTERRGSDVKAIETTFDGVLRGEKRFVTNGEFADVFVVSARSEGFGIFAVERDHVISERMEVSCFRGSGISKVRIDGKGKYLGDLKIALKSLVLGRTVISALALGMAKRCFDMALKRAKRRGVFEKLRWNFAELKSDTELVSNYVYATACDPNPVKSAICKLKASEIAKRCSDFAVEVFGAKGLIKHSLPEIYYRYSKGLDIGEGTSEIMKEIISRSL